MRKRRELGPAGVRAVAQLRRIARDLPASVETSSFGHPTFRVGAKAYAVLDRYAGSECVWVRVDPLDRRQLLRGAGWFESPYDPRREALCCRLEAVDWRRMAALIRASYRLASLRPAIRRG